MARARRSTAEVRRCALALLRGLELDAPLDPAVLCARLGEQRGRPIHLVQHRFVHSRIFGLWVGTSEADHVIVERATSPEHQRHIVLHEIGHIVFDHSGDAGGDGLWADLTAALPAASSSAALPRGSYDSPSEYEAELFASIVEGWAESMAAGPSRGTPSTFREVFDHPQGWR